MKDRECIARLTKEIRHQRLLLRFVVAAIAVTVLVGQGKAPKTLDHLRVRTLSIVDDKGIRRITLSVSPRNVATIGFTDKTGTRVRLLIEVSADDRCSLVMFNKTPLARVALVVTKDETAALTIGDSVGSSISAVRGAKGKAVLYVTDKDGHSVWRAPAKK